MKPIRKMVMTSLMVVLLAATIVVASPCNALARDDGFDDRYVFAATRSVDNMHVHPAWKVTLFPVTVAVDLAFLPFAVVAGYVG
jgi:hypothetical protein